MHITSASFQPCFNKIHLLIIITSQMPSWLICLTFPKMHPFVHMLYSILKFMLQKFSKMGPCLCLLDASCKLLYITQVFINS